MRDEHEHDEEDQRLVVHLDVVGSVDSLEATLLRSASYGGQAGLGYSENGLLL